jgi:hypothetical protein
MRANMDTLIGAAMLLAAFGFIAAALANVFR